MIVLRTLAPQTLALGVTATALLIGCGDVTVPEGTSESTSGSSGSGSASGGGGGGGQGWTTPACASVSGTAAVTFTLDEGATLTPTTQSLQGLGYTYGLVALDAPNTLVAEHQGQIIRSTDAGCTWSSLGAVASPLTLRAAPGGIAYAYQDNSSPLYRVEGTTITKLTAPVDGILGLGVDAGKSAHLRLGDAFGGLWDSTDAGATWMPNGVPAPVGSGPLVYRYGFDPGALDHVVVGSATSGAHVSTDGGMTWKASTGLGAHSVNVFTVVISPKDGDVVWAQGIDLDHSNDPGSSGRTIWRSTDGGLSFTAVVTQTPEIVLRNQELLAAHPTDPSVLYFVFGTYFQGYGTDIYRYDQATGKVTTTHNNYNDVSALAFSPGDAKVMYLGLTSDAVN